MLNLTPDEWTAIELSLRISIVATAFALPFGIALGWLLARKNFWGKTLLDGIVYLPLVLPPVVTGYLLLISFGRRGPIGAFLADHFGIVFSFAGRARRWRAASWVFHSWCVRSGRRSKPSTARLEDAAATLGADRSWVFLTITLPLALPGIIAGAVMCFRQSARRIRRHHHLRLQHPRRDADHLRGDLYVIAGSRRRSACRAAWCWLRSFWRSAR